MYRHVLTNGGVYDFLLYAPEHTKSGSYGAMVVTPGMNVIVDEFDTEAQAKAWLQEKRAELFPDHRCEGSCGALGVTRS
jgi:hypothetical protein